MHKKVVALFFNPEKENAIVIANEIIHFFKKHNISVVSDNFTLIDAQDLSTIDPNTGTARAKK